MNKNIDVNHTPYYQNEKETKEGVKKSVYNGFLIQTTFIDDSLYLLVVKNNSSKKTIFAKITINNSHEQVHNEAIANLNCMNFE